MTEECTQTLDQAARKHVEGEKPVYSRADFDAAPEYLFEETGLYGKHTPVTIGAGTAANENVRPMTGFVATMSTAQQAAAMAYDGPENHGDPAFERRRGDWMQTFSGKRFWPLDARTEDVDISDIAHALSMLCRYGGHSLRFYSVAEHSVHIARWLECQNYKPEVALAGLLHDATEAYLTDVPRPLKQSLPEYKECEAALWCVIADHFGLPGYLPMAVHTADNRILADEIQKNLKPMDWHAKHSNGLGVTLQFWSPEQAEKEFLKTYIDLVRRDDEETIEYARADREASEADDLYQFSKEQEAA